MRGGPLDAKQASRPMKRSDVHVVRAYEDTAAEVRRPERDALLTRVEEFFAGNAPLYSELELGDFRGDERVHLESHGYSLVSPTLPHRYVTVMT
ncbi:MAG: hypothetical protein HOV67_07480 [Kribbellaceae bacterium]|nr:hypothetical protein [Kribbellaceae bacterium]